LGKALLKDETGEILISLFGKQAEKLSEFDRGDKILLHGAYVSEYKDKLQLNLGFKGKIELLEKGNLEIAKIADLQVSNDVDVLGKIIAIFDQKEFSGGKLRGFVIADDSGTIRVTAWNEQVDNIKDFKFGDVVRIEGGYTKEGMRGLELHLGWKGRIKKTEEQIETRGGIQRKEIINLAEGEYSEIAGRITNVFREQSYVACPVCRKKVEPYETSFLCSEHGEVKGIERMVFTVEFDDGSGQIRLSIFDEKVSLGEYLVLQGRKKISEQGFEDFSVFKVIKPNYMAEAKRILEEE
jgi:hypothetical protein